MNETERAVRMWHESWDMRDPDRGATVIPDNCQFEDVARGEMQDNWADDEFVNRGTHTGPVRSSLGVFEPTGRKVEVRYCSVMRVENGKVVEGRDYYDSATFLRQLGLMD